MIYVISISVVALSLCVALLFFGSVLLGTAVQRKKYVRIYSKDCQVLSLPELTKADNVKNIICGVLGIIIGYAVLFYCSLFVLIILCLIGKNSSLLLIEIFIGVLIVLFVIHFIGVKLGCRLYTSYFNEASGKEKNL